MAEKEPIWKPKRLNQRRWTRPCHDCGAIIVFLEPNYEAEPGKKASRWIPVDMFGTKDGEPCFWEGSVVFTPAIHVRHFCSYDRRRIAWLLRRKEDDL